MRNQSVFKLNRQALIAAIISAAFPVASHAAAGRVEFAVGNVTASGADGQERTLAKGGEINSGDTIQTANGRTQIKFTDGGYMSLQPNTQFKVDDYAYDGKADGSEKGFFKLIKGGLRAITGAIGHTNKATYSINTPVATIGIRGTELTGEYSEEGDSKKLVVHVSHGSVFLKNDGGDLILFQGQSGAVTDNNQQPGYTDDETLVTAQGPNGGSAEENNEEQQQQQEQSTTFTQAEQVNGDGIPEAIIPTTPTDPNVATLAAMANYAAANAEGVYDLSNFATTGVKNEGLGSGGASGYTSKLTGGTIWANFQPAEVEAYLQVEVNGASGPFSGSITASGGIGVGGLGPTGLNLAGNGYLSGVSGSLCSGPCQFQATGLFKGPTAQIIGINYNINGFNGIISGGNINGTAGFHAPSVPAPVPPPI